ncbi:MAG TPA: HAD family hydrolase [Dehalococcoidia bacterium]|nr:HAD family hydrolase [Dehalococcoidia bacterium]
MPATSRQAARRVLLFDIDNTLLYSGGAGSAAMNAAFRQLFGIDNGFAGVEFSGRTDRYILMQALRRHAIAGDEDELVAAFQERYYALLRDTLPHKEGRLMPGFPQLLEALSAAPGVRLGLATGNFSGGARAKLAYFGLDRFFAPQGGFGEESEDRNEVVRVAVQRLADGAHPDDVLVIGDTPHDVSAALANGVVPVGVATGSNSAQELRDCGARMVFADFSDWRRAAATLAGAPAG